MMELANKSCVGSQPSRWLRPTLAPILRSAKMCRALATLGTVQIALALGHVRGVDCPVYLVTRLPCPGCGASRACAALLSRDLRAAFTAHPLSPILLAGWLLLVIAAIAPADCRTRLALVAERLERRAPLGLMFFITLCVVWLARLLFAPAGAAFVTSF